MCTFYALPRVAIHPNFDALHVLVLISPSTCVTTPELPAVPSCSEQHPSHATCSLFHLPPSRPRNRETTVTARATPATSQRIGKKILAVPEPWEERPEVRTDKKDLVGINRQQRLSPVQAGHGETFGGGTA